MLLVTAMGANCRHACASIYSVVVVETEKPAAALKVAGEMLDRVPADASLLVDHENTHKIQGLMMGAAYLLKHLLDRHGQQQTQGVDASAAAVQTEQPASTSGKSKRNKNKQQDPSKTNSQIQAGIAATVERFLGILGA